MSCFSSVISAIRRNLWRRRKLPCHKADAYRALTYQRVSGIKNGHTNLVGCPFFMGGGLDDAVLLFGENRCHFWLIQMI